jgi:spore germination protein
MYSRISGILLPVAAIALVITGIWGYNQSRQSQALVIRSENQYQQSFHSLSYHVDQLQDELGKTLVMNSPDQVKNSLNSVWRISYDAQNEVGHLPFSLMPFHRTQAFLNKVGAFAYSISTNKDLDTKGMTDGQRQQLKRLYNESKGVRSSLQNVQSAVIHDGARWTDAETTLSNQNTKHDNVIVDGFKTLETQVEHFPEIQWGPTSNPNEIRTLKPNASILSGPNLTSNQAKRKAASFLGRNDLQNFSISKNGDGMEYPSYSVSAPTKAGNSYMELTQKGGHVVWYLQDRNIGTQKLDLRQGQQAAEKWLSNHNYPDMQLVSTEQYDGLGVYQFAYAPHNATVYPEKMTLKVALDNGEIVGMQAKDLVFHHPQISNVKPKLTLSQAKRRVNRTLKIEDGNLTVVHNQQGTEIPVYAFTGTMDSDTYRVYINANSGAEEGVEKLTK